MEFNDLKFGILWVWIDPSIVSPVSYPKVYNIKFRPLVVLIAKNTFISF